MSCSATWPPTLRGELLVLVLLVLVLVLALLLCC